MSECKQCKSLIQDVVDDYTSGCSSCYPIAMAKMQQRIAELSERHPEWVCYVCNTVYPIESVKKISDCLCPNGCGEVLKPRSQTERLLEQRISELETQVRSIALSRDELAATVERLLEFDVSPDEYHRLVSSKRYKQNLNAVNREVLLILARDLATTGEIESSIIECIEVYANTKYPSGKDGE